LNIFTKRNLTCGVFAVCSATSAIAEDQIPQIDQADLNAEITSNGMGSAFLEAFEAGDELTEFQFTKERGVGVNVGEGRIFTRFPRADLDGPGEWATHFPTREGGANATSCIACHNAPFANGAGDVALNVVVDPAHTGDPSLYLERNTLPLFALGIPQRLAEEMSLALYVQREEANALACDGGTAVADLSAKGVSFGQLTLTRVSASPCVVETDTTALEGIDDDLVVRAFGWKGNMPTIREFTRGASHNELGLQAVELVGDADGDYDGVTNELTVGDVTALTIYMAGLERPVSMIELADVGLLDMDDAWRNDIAMGAQHFETVACASCHTPSMELDDPVFSEPSTVPGFYDVAFPDGSDPADHGLSMQTALTIDLSADQPNNQIALDDGTTYLLGALEKNAAGTAVARWYTDLKRHDMGAALSDPDDPLGIGAATFLTRSLAGVGATGPWLHDGRATTLEEAILAHGGDAQTSVNAFAALTATEQAQVITFLENLTYYAADHE
jgi:hypothetical protein